MTPLSVAHTELRLFVLFMEREHKALALAEQVRRAAGAPPSFDGWEDLRTVALGQLWELLDRVEPELGLRLMKALFPTFVTGDAGEGDADTAAAQLRLPAIDPHWEAGA